MASCARSLSGSYERDLSGLVYELPTRSDAFRTRRAVSSDAGLTMAAYTAEPGCATHDALSLLACGAATLDQADAANAVDGL